MYLDDISCSVFLLYPT